MKRRETACLRGKLRRQKHGGIFMKKMTKRIALALSMVLFALAFTACGPNLLSGGDGGSRHSTPHWWNWRLRPACGRSLRNIGPM